MGRGVAVVVVTGVEVVVAVLVAVTAAGDSPKVAMKGLGLAMPG